MNIVYTNLVKQNLSKISLYIEADNINNLNIQMMKTSEI